MKASIEELNYEFNESINDTKVWWDEKSEPGVGLGTDLFSRTRSHQVLELLHDPWLTHESHDLRVRHEGLHQGGIHGWRECLDGGATLVGRFGLAPMLQTGKQLDGRRGYLVWAMPDVVSPS